MYDHFSGVYEGVKMVPTTLPVSENTVLVDMKLCTKPHGFMWTSMASKSRLNTGCLCHNHTSPQGAASIPSRHTMMQSGSVSTGTKLNNI